MSGYDLSRDPKSRAELDQRSRAARLRLESLQRALAMRMPEGPSRLGRVARLLRLGGYGRRHRHGRAGTTREAEGQGIGAVPRSVRPSWPAAALARCDGRPAGSGSENVLPIELRHVRGR